MPVKKLKAKSEKLKAVKVESSKINKKPVPRSGILLRETTTEGTEKRGTLRSLKSSISGKTVVARGLTVDVYDLKGKAISKMSLPKEVFDGKINSRLMAQAVRVYLTNQRSGSHSTKTRGEVRGSTRKIYRQKGTGRARHGGIRAPIFVGGGIAHGPKPYNYSLRFPQKMKKASLVSALTSKLKNNEIRVISGLEKIEPKTKLVAEALKNLNLDGRVLLVIPDKIENVKRAARNIQKIDVLEADNLNTYAVLDNKAVLLMKDAVEVLKRKLATTESTEGVHEGTEKLATQKALRKKGVKVGLEASV